MGIKAVRKFIGLRLIDLERATGIRAERISEAERGLTQLSPSERRTIENFLRARLTSTIASIEARPELTT
jgi:hypothetical protein